MPMTARCPNASCGHVSRLVDDPLGRIFRCPRCLTKLPTAPAAAADSGWTAIDRPSSAGGGRVGPRGRSVAMAGSDPTGIGAGSWDGGGPGIAVADGDSAEFGVGLAAVGRERLRPRVGPGLRPGRERRGLHRADVAAREPGLGVEHGVAVGVGLGDGGVAAASAPSVAVGSGEAGQLGRFRILGVLGQGQHATVYRAYDALLDRDVALKVPRPGVLRTERALERFLGEARAQARLRHPRIVPVYEAGRAGDRHYIAMALIEGRGLDDRLAEDGPIPPDRAAGVAAELAEALAYAHALGVVHRDVKPANVRVDHQGEVYLMDFGIAYRPDSNELPAPPGTILGTPAYVAPEQAEGGRTDPLPASDQYSLGAVFYELLCGRPPFVGPPSYVLYPRDPPRAALAAQGRTAGPPPWRPSA